MNFVFPFSLTYPKTFPRSSSDVDHASHSTFSSQSSPHRSSPFPSFLVPPLFSHPVSVLSVPVGSLVQSVLCTLPRFCQKTIPDHSRTHILTEDHSVRRSRSVSLAASTKSTHVNPYDRRFRSASLSSTSHHQVSIQPAQNVSTPAFCPSVKASEQLSRWSSPFALAAKQELCSSIPTQLADKADLAVLDSFAPNTRTSYAAGILHFTQFCDAWDIPEPDRMPASSALLVAFASSYVGHYRGKTISQWLSSVRSWHIINHAPWHGNDERLHLVRKAADK